MPITDDGRDNRHMCDVSDVTWKRFEMVSLSGISPVSDIRKVIHVKWMTNERNGILNWILVQSTRDRGRKIPATNTRCNLIAKLCNKASDAVCDCLSKRCCEKQYDDNDGTGNNQPAVFAKEILHVFCHVQPILCGLFLSEFKFEYWSSISDSMNLL